MTINRNQNKNKNKGKGKGKAKAKAKVSIESDNKLKFTIEEICKRFEIGTVPISKVKTSIDWNGWSDTKYLIKEKDEIQFIKTAIMCGCDLKSTIDQVLRKTVLPKLGLDKMYGSFLKTFGDVIDWDFFSKYSEWPLDLLEQYKDKYVWKHCTK